MISYYSDLKPRSNKFNLILLIVYALLLLTFCSQMSPLYPINDWDDVNLYFNIGKCLTKGHTLYTETFDQKGPVIFFIYALGYLISNTSFFGVFLLEFIAWLIIILSIYNAAKLFLDEEFAFLSSLIFPIFTLTYTANGGSAEEFVLAFIALSSYLFLRYFSQLKIGEHNPWWMFIHGIMCSLAFFTKVNLVLLWFFPLIAVFILIIFSHKYKNLFFNIIAFLLGVALIACPILLYLYKNNALDDAYNTYIVLNSKYANIQSVQGVLTTLSARLYSLARYNLTFFALSFIGVFIFPLALIPKKIAKLAFILCGISLYVSISMGLTFHHYYLLPFSIFCGFGLIAICAYVKKYVSIKCVKQISILSLIILLMVGIKEKNLFNVGGEILLRQSEPDNLAYRFGKIIEKENNPTLLNLGFGYGNSIFTVYNIMPNTKYFITPNIPYDMFPDMRNQQEKDIENKKIQFVILTNFSVNYDFFKDLPAFKTNYTLIDTYISDIAINKIFYTYYLYKRND